MRALKHASLSLGNLCPFRQSKKVISRVQNRTMLCHSSSGWLSGLVVSENEWLCHDGEMEPQGGKHLAASCDETNRTPEEDHSQIVGARSISWADCPKNTLSASSR